MILKHARDLIQKDSRRRTTWVAGLLTVLVSGVLTYRENKEGQDES